MRMTLPNKVTMARLLVSPLLFLLILFFEDSRVELYNLAADIGETRDLAGLEPNRAADMRGRLEAWLRETGAQIPQPNPAYDPKRELEPGKPSGPVTAK